MASSGTLHMPLLSKRFGITQSSNTWPKRSPGFVEVFQLCVPALEVLKITTTGVTSGNHERQLAESQ